MTKLKTQHLKTQKHKQWQNTKTQNVTKFKNLKCDGTQRLKMWKNSKNPNMKKTSKNHNVTKIKQKNVTKLKKRSNCDKPYLVEFWKMVELVGRESVSIGPSLSSF